jgi:RHS repeat-associated protein
VLVAQSDGFGSAATKTLTRDPVSLIATTAQDPNGNKATATLATYGSAGTSQLTSANVLSAIDRAGNTIQAAYNAFNQAWCQVDGADYANGVRCPTSAPSGPPAPGVSDPYLGVTLSFYNGADQLTARTDPLGNTAVYAYTGSGAGVPAGLLYCSVDPVDYQAGVVCPAYGQAHVRGTATISYDSAGDPTARIDANGNTTSAAYGDAAHPGFPSQMTDPDGTVTAFSYDGAGRVTKKKVSFGSYSAMTLLAYDSAERLYCQVDPQQAAKGVVCPSSPPSPSSPPAGVTSVFYDADGRVVQTTGPTGATTLSAFDQAGNLFCTVAPQPYARGVRCPASSPSSPPTPGNDSYLGATISTFDAFGRVAQETNALGGITLDSYDVAGNLIQETVKSDDQTNAPPVTTTYGYDADQRVTSTTGAPGTSIASTTLSSYDPNGHVYCTVSAAAYTLGAGGYQCPTWQAGWITAPPNPASLYSTSGQAGAKATSTRFFDAAGRLRQTSNPDAATAVKAYDADGRVYCSADPTDATSWLNGHPTAAYPYLCPATPPSTPPTGGSNPGYQINIYDSAGQMTATADGAGDPTTMTYDPAGKVLTVTDPRGNATTNCYYWQTATCASGAPAGGGSGSDRFLTTSPPSQASPAGIVTSYTYLEGEATKTVATPAGVATSAYDPAGQLASTTYSNTAAGYAQPANVSYVSNPDGTRQSMTDGTGTTTYTYNDLGRPLSVAFTPAAGSGLAAKTVGYTWFANDQLKTIAYPAFGSYSAPSATRSYDAAGRLATVTDFAGKISSFGYDPDSNNTTSALPNGTTNTQPFNLGDVPTSATAAPTNNPGSPFAKITYQRNPAEQVASETDTGALGASGAYTYDPADRLATDTLGSGSTAVTSPYRYDYASNPTRLLNGRRQTFDAANELCWGAVSTGTIFPSCTTQPPWSPTYGYDTRGDRISQTAGGGAGLGLAYGYDQASRLTGVTRTATQNIVVGGGNFSSSVLRPDGTIQSFGNNSRGSLGNGTTTNSTTPVNVVGGATGQPVLSNVVALGGSGDLSSGEGADHFVALRADGSVLAWGANTYGQLGNGTTTDANAPVQMTYPSGAPLAGAIAVGVAKFASFAVRGDGTVWGTGMNWNGVLGDGTTTNRSNLVEAVNANGTAVSGAVGVACNEYDTAAVKSDGTVWQWGATGYPTQVAGLSGVVQVSSADLLNEFVAVTRTGAVYTWTTSGSGTFGGGTSTAPVQVTGLPAIKAITAGYKHILGLTNDGHVWAWGYNADGELGNGTTTNSFTTPVQVLNPAGTAPLANVTAIGAGNYHSLAALADGSVYGWGANNYGQLGNGTITYATTLPVQVSGYATQPNTTIASYTYNGDGLRVIKNTGGITQQFVWDTSGDLPLTLSDGANSYIYGPDGLPIEQVATNGTTLYYQHDQLGSTRLLTNSTGGVAGTATYDPYGKPLTTTGTTTPIGYAGQYTDPETGLSYMRARYYDPATAQFLTVDPLVDQTAAPYTYTGDNPITNTDPTGLQRIDQFDLDRVPYLASLSVAHGLGESNDRVGKDYFNARYLAGQGHPLTVRGVNDLGNRNFDLSIYPPLKLAWEIKVTKYAKWGGWNKVQARKDKVLSIEYNWGIEWDILPDRNGKANASPSLVQYLDGAAIDVVVHHFKDQYCPSQAPNQIIPIPLPLPIPQPIPQPIPDFTPALV